MNRFPLSLTTLAVATLLAGSAFAQGNNGNTTLVCHVSGNGSVSPLYVNSNAISAHLNHGDFSPITFYADADGDGWINPDDTVLACAAPAGYAASGPVDCDDTDATVQECGPCDTTVKSTCTIDLATGAASCDNGNPVSTVSTYNGLVLRADMANWTAMVASFDVDLPDVMSDNWALNIGNSPSNNGWGGDSSHFANDSEIQLWNNGVQVLANDFTSATFLPGVSPATDLAGDSIEATVCDGYFAWENNAGFTETISPYLFQIDGDEYDPQAGGLNDTLLWIGVGRTIGSAGRDGSGVQNLTLTFWD